MKCQKCVDAGERSEVRFGPSFKTAMGVDQFWDADGIQHTHNPNAIVTHYSCSRGHLWEAVTHAPCPAPRCDWTA